MQGGEGVAWEILRGGDKKFVGWEYQLLISWDVRFSIDRSILNLGLYDFGCSSKIGCSISGSRGNSSLPIAPNGTKESHWSRFVKYFSVYKSICDRGVSVSSRNLVVPTEQSNFEKGNEIVVCKS